MASSEKRKSDKLASQALMRNYGITLKEYVAMLSKQGGVCYICQRPAKTRRLAVDHKHFKVEVKPVRRVQDVKWKAYLVDYPDVHVFGKVQKVVIKELKQKVKKMSVRGCLCSWCNPGLKKFQDDPVRLRRAAEYLERYQEKLRRQFK